MGTQQLNQINQRLDKIQRSLEKLYIRQEANILGEIHYALSVLDDVLDERMNTGHFTTDMLMRLANAEKSIQTILERDRILVDYFGRKAKQVKQHRGRKGAHVTAELLKEDGPQAVNDTQCLVGLIMADLKLEQVRLLVAMQENPRDISRRQERIQHKMADYTEVIEDLPSVEELHKYAAECLAAMSWWDKMCSKMGGWFGTGVGTKVDSATKLNLKDYKPDHKFLKPSLNGYIFWKDEQGTHVFSMPGEDLELVEVLDSITI